MRCVHRVRRNKHSARGAAVPSQFHEQAHIAVNAGRCPIPYVLRKRSDSDAVAAACRGKTVFDARRLLLVYTHDSVFGRLHTFIFARAHTYTHTQYNNKRSIY